MANSWYHVVNALASFAAPQRCPACQTVTIIAFLGYTALLTPLSGSSMHKGIASMLAG